MPPTPTLHCSPKQAAFSHRPVQTEFLPCVCCGYALRVLDPRRPGSHPLLAQPCRQTLGPRWCGRTQAAWQYSHGQSFTIPCCMSAPSWLGGGWPEIWAGQSCVADGRALLFLPSSASSSLADVSSAMRASAKLDTSRTEIAITVILWITHRFLALLAAYTPTIKSQSQRQANYHCGAC
jgi:hypothetical protein